MGKRKGDEEMLKYDPNKALVPAASALAVSFPLLLPGYYDTDDEGPPFEDESKPTPKQKMFTPRAHKSISTKAFRAKSWGYGYFH